MKRTDWPDAILAHAMAHYPQKPGDVRWDYIVECMGTPDIAEQFCDEARSYREALGRAKAHAKLLGGVAEEHEAEARAGCDPDWQTALDEAMGGPRYDGHDHEVDDYHASLCIAERESWAWEAETAIKRTAGCSCDDAQLIFVGCDCGIEEGRPPRLPRSLPLTFDGGDPFIPF